MSTMQVHFNLKNICIVLIGACFVYLSYLLWGSGSADHFPDVEVELRDLVSYAILAAETGGHAVSEVHKEKRLQAAKKGQTKEGADEFVTRADLISNQLILDTLKRFPGIRIVSEEKSTSFDDSELEPYRLDKYAQWLNSRDLINRIPSRKHKLSTLAIWVDPLDATQEYTEDLLEYVTVMVCIVASGQPIFGVIYRPFHDETVFGMMGWGVMTSKGGRKLPVREHVPEKIMVSRSHAGTVEELAKKAFGESYTVEAAGGSGYKVLRLVNGTAELYMHRTAIKKWDTCAGDAIVRAAGGSMLDLEGADQTYWPDEPVKNEKGLLVALTNPFTYYQKIEPFIKEDSEKNV